MNFVKLLFELKLENEVFSKYTSLDYIKLEKRIKAERKINNNFSTDAANKLTKSVKNYPEELNDFIKEKNLSLIFLGIRHYHKNRNSFSHPNFDVFFDTFLEEDLTTLFKQKNAIKDYATLEKIMLYKKYFSFDFENYIKETLHQKLANAYFYYSNKPFIKHREYAFLENRAFFKLINHIDSATVNSYILNIYNTIVTQINHTNYSKYPLKCLIAFAEYKTEDPNFKKTLAKNKDFSVKRLAYLSSKYSFKEILPLLIIILWWFLMYLLFDF